MQTQATQQATTRLFSYDIIARRPRTPNDVLRQIEQAERSVPARERLDVARLRQRVGSHIVWVKFNDADKQPVTVMLTGDKELSWAEIIWHFSQALPRFNLGGRDKLKGMEARGFAHDGNPVYFAYLGRW